MRADLGFSRELSERSVNYLALTDVKAWHWPEIIGKRTSLCDHNIFLFRKRSSEEVIFITTSMEITRCHLGFRVERGKIDSAILMECMLGCTKG